MNFKKGISCLAAIIIGLLSSCAVIKEEPLLPLLENELKILKFMGGEVLPDGNLAIGKIKIHRRSNQISFPGKVNITDGDLEVLISTPTGRAHESLLVTDIDPYKLQLALLLIGAENGMRNTPDPDKNTQDKQNTGLARGTLIDIFVKPENGEEVPVEHWLENKQKSAEKKQDGWVFVGSSFSSNKKCLATEEGNIVNIWTFGNTILDNPSDTGDTDDFFVSYTKNMPEFETPVSVVMKIRNGKSVNQ
jgi:hypothetical protein